MAATIRMAMVSDAREVLAIYAPIVRETAITYETEVPSESEIAGRISSTLEAYPWLCCEIDGRFAGYAYASRFRTRTAYQWTAETTVYVAEWARKRGVARGLYASLLECCRVLGYRTAVGVIGLPNEPSVRFHVAMGFVEVGVFHRCGYKFNRWQDAGWYERAIGAYEMEPAVPPALKTPTVCAGSAEWLVAMGSGLSSIGA
ncbi:MAG: GNAT family N-acetyltransferase [Phycisphaerales bacterium]|nr:GNAT family N-acetyltransferase [Phycisphaerales bacterium]